MSEILSEATLFPCECGTEDDFYIRLTAYSRAGFHDSDYLGSEYGTGGYDGIEVDETYGVQCMGCDKFYEVEGAKNACKSYRLYLDAKDEKEKSAAWDSFLQIRKQAERADK